MEGVPPSKVVLTGLGPSGPEQTEDLCRAPLTRVTAMWAGGPDGPLVGVVGGRVPRERGERKFRAELHLGCLPPAEKFAGEAIGHLRCAWAEQPRAEGREDRMAHEDAVIGQTAP